MWGDELLEKCYLGNLRVSFWNGIYIFLVLIISIVFTVPAIIIPQNNVIDYPQYWWELIIQTAFGILPFGINTYLECKTIFRYERLASYGCLARQCGVLMVATVTLTSFTILLWVWILEHNLPFPFFGMVQYLSGMTTHLIHMWFEFPSELREDKIESKRIRSYFWYRLWFILYGFQKFALKFILLALPTAAQPVMALIFPLARELNLRVLSKFLENASDPKLTNEMVPKLTATISVNVVNSFFVSLIIASNATVTTSNCIIAVDFLLNIYSSVRIVQFHQKTTPKDAIPSLESTKYDLKKKEETLDLYAVESIEYLVPLIYTVTFLIAFYGPNADIIGNVGMTKWKFQGVEDVKSYIEELLKIFAIDLAALIVSTVIFWKLASINMLREGYKIMKLYWPLIAVKIGNKIYQVSKYQSEKNIFEIL